jgi:hypothetical protein
MQMQPADKLWLPGQGVVDIGPMKVHRALQAYDERLLFGRINDPNHPGYGDWCAFVKMPHGSKFPILPVIGFGKEMPTPEEAVQRCNAANTRRHGDKILHDIKADDDRRRKSLERAADANSDMYVEIMKEAQGVKAPQIFVPRGI